ncbi:MAG: TetR/AcrR family transcriptional regulator [Ignavibacteriaceae bacterium]|nr:TetR/AcrR family transcriptional regulator [Ignavibacteriaceae bacterium]NUM70957.1 TetR/AcrR family transcriptional regulator [Ignavibacteriaceae bacterium]
MSDSKKEEILIFCRQKFFSGGFYKTTMDEIASELRVSKKTLYKHFPSKDDLVRETIMSHIGGVANKVSHIVDSDEPTVIKFKKIINIIAAALAPESEIFWDEFKEHMTNHWEEIERFREIQIRKNFGKLFSDGISEGVMRAYPPELTITVFLAMIRSVVNPVFLSKSGKSFDTVVKTVFEIIKNAFFTDEGLKQLNENNINGA